jgi:uncharacterized protein YjiS (DUF1127 family)
LKEITMCWNDEAGLWIARSRWAPEERENFKRQIIERAQRARAQAFLDLAEVMLVLPQALVGSGWRGLRRLGGRVADVASRWWKAYALRRRRWAAVRELHALDDRMLWDIGLGRSEIESAIRDPERVMARELAYRAAGSTGGGRPKLVTKPAAQRISKNAA